MSNAFDRILDAAENLIIEDGVGRLTLDAVAARAGVSKGGLLYHFKSKDVLVKSMLTRLLSRFEESMAAQRSSDPESAGRFTRGYLQASFPGSPENEKEDRICSAILAGVAGDASLLDPMRDKYAAWQSALEDDQVDPVDATIVRLAADGLWMSDLFKFPPLTPDMRRRVLDRLEEFTRGVKA